MEIARMQSNSEIGPKMLAAIVSRRWAQFQATRWASGEVQTADLQARGVTVDARTVTKWRSGQLPGNRHKIELMGAGFASMLEHAFEPAAAAGRIAELEAKIEEQERAARAARRELTLIREAFACGHGLLASRPGVSGS